MEEANEKFMEEAAKAQTVEELMELARTHGVEVTEDEARIFLSLRSGDGEALSDEALDGVAGGGLRQKGKLIVTSFYTCDLFKRERGNISMSRSCENCTYYTYSSPFNTCRIR